MTFAGTPDWQRQQAPTQSYLGSFAVNTATSQSFDLSALLQPQHTAIQVYWVADITYTGQPINLFVLANVGTLIYQPQTTVDDGSYTYVPIPGQLAVGEPALGCLLDALPQPGAPTPAVGTLYVVAYTNPIERALFETFHENRPLFTTGTVNCPNGATTTVLAAPQTGKASRVRILSWRSNNAAIAGGGVIWLTGGGSVPAIQTQAVDNTRQDRIIVCDIIVPTQIQLQNTLTAAISASIAYEVVPI